eukprot:350891-Chlamydomonas_euryale.AAC.4
MGFVGGGPGGGFCCHSSLARQEGKGRGGGGPGWGRRKGAWCVTHGAGAVPPSCSGALSVPPPSLATDACGRQRPMREPMRGPAGRPLRLTLPSPTPFCAVCRFPHFWCGCMQPGRVGACSLAVWVHAAWPWPAARCAAYRAVAHSPRLAVRLLNGRHWPPLAVPALPQRPNVPLPTAAA